MIPDIGLMIAAYIVTRMAVLLGQPHPQANPVAKVLAGITIVLTAFLSLDLIVHGMTTTLPPLR